MPESISALADSIRIAFGELGFELPHIYFNENNLDEPGLMNSFVHVDDGEGAGQCWVGFDDATPDITESPECPFIASVSTRNDWLLAGGVAYGICRDYGELIFNDSCQLDGNEQYSAELMRQTIQNLRDRPR